MTNDESRMIHHIPRTNQNSVSRLLPFQGRNRGFHCRHLVIPHSTFFRPYPASNAYCFIQ